MELLPPPTWAKLCQRAELRDLPYKIELDAQGKTLMSPTTLWHGRVQHRIGRLIEDLIDAAGEIVTASAVQADEEVRVADVGWLSAVRWAIVSHEWAASTAPEICVAVLSPGNSTEEMETKQALYFAAGAQEVWICDAEGRLFFFDANGARPASARVPRFPAQIAR